jgi:hypothetical protein
LFVTVVTDDEAARPFMNALRNKANSEWQSLSFLFPILSLFPPG